MITRSVFNAFYINCKKFYKKEFNTAQGRAIYHSGSESASRYEQHTSKLITKRYRRKKIHRPSKIAPAYVFDEF